MSEICVCASCGGEMHSGPCADPAPPHRRSIDAAAETLIAATREVLGDRICGTSTPAHREGVVYLGDVPAGAQLLMYNGRTFIVGPGIEPSWVTPTGLQPLELMGVANHG